MKCFITQIEAVDPLDGQLKVWAGQRIWASDLESAEILAKEKAGYLRVVGQLIEEIR